MMLKKISFAMWSAAIVLSAAGTASAAEHRHHGEWQNGQLMVPAVVERTGVTPVVYHMPLGFTGHAEVHVVWTDVLGRTVEDRTIPADLIDETEIALPLDGGRAVAMKNHLHVEVALDGQDIQGRPVKRQDTGNADFIARPGFSGWKDYHIMMWQPYPAEWMPALQSLGIDGGQYSSRKMQPPDWLLNNDMRWYAESLATDYYSEYHRFRSDRPVGWSFIEAKKLYKQDPNSLAAFKRHPSFWDPYWRKVVHDRALESVKENGPYRPFFYSLADESGIGELEAQWDFDFSDESLVPMRRWLKSEYGSLGALNREWGTNYTDWNLVMPETTNQAMARPGENFAPWADFKAWMDLSYANALKMGMDSIHEADPKAYVAVGGGQMPGWGGYDYTRITKSLNAIEPYDIGRSVDIVHSLNPKMVILSTGFAAGPWERHRVWYELLHGEGGLIIWSEQHNYLDAKGQPSAIGRGAGEYYNEIRDGFGALILNSRPVNDTIAIHYSQPSMRTEWMLERRPDGAAWMTRSPSYERSNNVFMRVRESWSNLIQDEGWQYNFVGYDQVPRGELLRRGYRVLVLPQSSSLSASEAQAIREFVAAGGVAIATGMPGTYDEHSRKLDTSSLADLFGGAPGTEHAYGQGKAILLNADVAGYLEDRLTGKEGPLHGEIEKLLEANGVHPEYAVTDAAGHAVVGEDVHVFANGGVRLVTIQSNPQERVNELGPPDFRSNKRFEKPVTVRLRLPDAMYAYDTRAGKALGQQTEMTLTIDPYDPTILAVSPAPLPALRVAVPAQARRGTTMEIAVSAGPALEETSVFHVEVKDPAGHRAIQYSGNILGGQGSGVKAIPLAVNDAAGRWTVTVHDLLSGETVTRGVDVE